MSIFEGLTEKATNMAKIVAKKSNELVEVAKLNISINNERDRIDKLCIEMGKSIYESFEKGEPVSDGLKDKCEQIQSINLNIRSIEQKLLDLKNSRICGTCGAEIDSEFAFCFKCGTKQEICKSSEQDIGQCKVQYAEIYCPSCGAANPSDYAYCCKCGAGLR